jgi:hypothetical protein
MDSRVVLVLLEPMEKQEIKVLQEIQAQEELRELWEKLDFLVHKVTLALLVL